MEVGTLIGAYRILQPIGEGGMGAVYLAEHGALGRRAAIKVLHPMFGMRPEIVARFFNEARAASAITDPGIVQIFDFGHHTDGSAYIVMELLEGQPLDQRLRQHRALPIEAALRIIRQVAKSLGAAHARGIVHRDLKPENIFLVRDEEVPGGERAKLLDFGIAKLLGDTSIKTQTSAVMGTPLYMSPEQCRGAGAVDERADIYSLGCVLFTLLAGRPPFDAEGGGEIIAMHLREPAPRLASLVPGLAPAVDALVARCLEKSPERRFANGAELAAAISQLGAQPAAALGPLGAQPHGWHGAPSPVPAQPHGAPAPVSAQPHGVPAHAARAHGRPVHTASTTLTAASGAFRPGRARKTSFAVIGAVATLVGAAIAVPVVLRSSDAPTASADPATAAAATAPVANATPQPAESAGAAPSAATTPQPTSGVPESTAAAPPAGTPPQPASGTPAAATAEPAAPAGATRPPDGKSEAAASPSAEPAAVPRSERSRRAAVTGAVAKPSDDASSRPGTLAKRDKKASSTAHSAAAGQTAASAEPVATPDDAKSKPDSTLPPKLDRRLISAGVYTVRERIMACGDRGPGAQIRLSVTVAPDGKVTGVTAKDSPYPLLTACVTAAMKAAIFSPTQAGGAFSQPFSF